MYEAHRPLHVYSFTMYYELFCLHLRTIKIVYRLGIMSLVAKCTYELLVSAYYLRIMICDTSYYIRMLQAYINIL